MGWNNPAMPWRELESALSGRLDLAHEAPISGRKARPRVPGVTAPTGPVVPYAELHCHSNFSFLDGASAPEELVAEAVSLGLHGLALTDHDGFAGAPMFAEAAREHPGLRTVHGAELSLGLDAAQLGVADPAGTHLLVLARGVEGYHRLAGAMTEAHLRGDEKGRPDHDLDELVDRGRGHWVVLTGCRKGAVRQALAAGGPPAAAAALRGLVDLFGHEHVVVELHDHGHPGEGVATTVLAGLAAEHGLPVVATNNVHYARPAQRRLAAAMAAVRARRSLAELDGWLPASGLAHLRSGEEMARRFARHPDAVARSVVLADELAFDLRRASPRLPKRGIPAGHTPASWLRELTERGFAERYAGTPHEAAARERVERELAIIERKDFPGYFVIVHDIVAFARAQGILCQGRGSAASSAVCYALGITAIDSVRYGLPFERFISQHRDEEPDIDVDFASDRREEVIQWVYETYGRRNAAQVANVIGYRPKMAVRDAAKALGYSPGQQDAWSKQVTSWTTVVAEQLAEGRPETAPAAPHEAPPPAVVALAEQLVGAPRHLGIHSGGMVLTEQPIGEVCPIERARMDRRTVLQWDKDACASMGLVKFDLLGLGMLSALHHMIAMAAEHLGEHWELHSLPKEEPAVYDMLCRADSIGVFQVESRAQIGTLPRLRPRCFYDLAIEIALIRPGPIQGGAVHPYIRRAMGQDPITYPHDSVREVLERTRGVPLFQEQLMQMAMILGDCDADDADLLRRAMGSKRGLERIERIERKLYEGMARKGITGERADTIYLQIRSFANFGFAESHALSFALLVYASSWFKLHHPGAFLAGLLRAQPMGFYAPQSLVRDAVRHGVEVRRPDLVASGVEADLEPLAGPGAPRPAPTGLAACAHDHPGEAPPFVEGTPDPTPVHRRDGGFAVRMGLSSVRGIGRDVAARIVAAREERPFRDLTDLSRRAGLDAGQLEALATAGVCEGLGLDRRQALWQAGWTEREEHLEGIAVAPAAPTLPVMDDVGTMLADLWATGVTTGIEQHPFAYLRPALRQMGIHAVTDLTGALDGTPPQVEDKRRVNVAGVVTHRQRPGTAGGVTFLNLEDETGMLNVVCGQGLWRRHRAVATRSQTMVVRGVVERRDGVTNLVADKLSALADVHPEAAGALETRLRSRDFR